MTPRRTTQKPAVLTIGPAGENLSRMACLIHDASNAAGQGGFGAVWGAKNFKAVSVIGTGDIKVHDPKALMSARLWQKRNYAFDLKNIKSTSGGTEFQSLTGTRGALGYAYRIMEAKGRQRPQVLCGLSFRLPSTLSRAGSAMRRPVMPLYFISVAGLGTSNERQRILSINTVSMPTNCCTVCSTWPTFPEPHPGSRERYRLPA